MWWYKTFSYNEVRLLNHKIFSSWIKLLHLWRDVAPPCGVRTSAYELNVVLILIKLYISQVFKVFFNVFKKNHKRTLNQYGNKKNYFFVMKLVFFFNWYPKLSLILISLTNSPVFLMIDILNKLWNYCDDIKLFLQIKLDFWTTEYSVAE